MQTANAVWLKTQVQSLDYLSGWQQNRVYRCTIRFAAKQSYKYQIVYWTIFAAWHKWWRIPLAILGLGFRRRCFGALGKQLQAIKGRARAQ